MFDYFRTSSSEHMGMGGSATLMGDILMLLTRVLIAVVILVVIVGICAWIKTNFSDSKQSLVQSINRDPMLKTILVTGAVILVIATVMSVYYGPPGNQVSMQAGSLYYGTGNLFNINGLLMFIIDILVLATIASLILAAFSYLRGKGMATPSLLPPVSNLEADSDRTSDPAPEIEPARPRTRSVTAKTKEPSDFDDQV
ncbi:MAG: hypothetical protein ACM3PP_08190 [Candidatus Saccharibacteria bacterium]